MNELDLLSIGDASLDVFLTPTESETFCEVDTHKSLLCFTYGDKIPVKDLSMSTGGNAANNALGTRRLGVNSAVVLTLGDDDMGSSIVASLESEGVNTEFIAKQPETSSNYSTIISVSGERTIFTFKVPRDYVFPQNLPKVKWVYLTSLGERFSFFYTKFIKWAKQNPQAKIAYNPGSRQLRAGVSAFKDILSTSYIIYVNRKEAEKITGLKHSHGKEKELLNALSKLGPKTPIITDGPEGAFAYDGNNYYRVGILPVDAYERTGAGDAFGSGCLAALIKGKSLKEALLWGTVNSASVIGYSGAQRGLLKENEMEEWFERCKSSGVKVEEF
ncbi:carbohydrate kinase family protein [Patescibacteria group bacterium]|nr:carbohydrate kinase family protein [Patescibacteria group bacterium]